MQYDIEYPTADDFEGVNFLYPVSAGNSNSGGDGGSGGGCFMAVIDDFSLWDHTLLK